MAKKNEALRLYYVHIADDDCGLGVVARTVGEARVIMHKSGHLMEDSFIDLRARLIKDGDVSGLKLGDIITDSIDGLKRGCFGWAEAICPMCGHEGMLKKADDKIGCEDCLGDSY
jgi:hypothetical protein